MSRLLHAIAGPRVPAAELRARPWRYALPALSLSAARVAILVSMFLPYWTMVLEAPQYPDGLHVQAYVNHLTGDVAEIDGLNHYIGMRPLEDAAQLERSISVYLLIAVVLLVEGAMHIHSKWAVLLVVPVIVFPPFFLIDLHLWLDHFGNNLDPAAPLSSAIKPFTPPVLGTGVIGQFKTHASAGPGLWLAVGASACSIAGLVLHRRAFKPLFDRMRAEERTQPAARGDGGEPAPGAAS
ncbi:MAG: hypothetical protein R3B68_13310 [Phycisphaerales bacterium]